MFESAKIVLRSISNCESRNWSNWDRESVSGHPMLLDFAESLGIKVTYTNRKRQDILGMYIWDSDEVELYVTYEPVFYHELAHAIHRRLDINYSESIEEVTCDIVACILFLEYYGIDESKDIGWTISQYGVSKFELKKCELNAMKVINFLRKRMVRH